MRHGFFDDDQREYVITSPETPSPWINYLGCEKFFSLFSQTGGGYSFYRDPRLRRITRYRYNNIPIDSNGRYFYIRDEADNDFWSIGYMPVKRPVDRFECRHGLGYSRIESRRKDITSTILAFVPIGHNCELMHVTLENHSVSPRRLKLFSFVEFCFWNALDDMTNFQRNLSVGEVEVVGQTIYHVTEYRERRNHFAFFHVNHPVAAFDSDRDSFLGPYNGLDEPRAVSEGTSRNSLASGWSPIGSHCIEIALRPNENKEVTFVLGYVENPAEKKWHSKGVINKEPAEAIIESFQTKEQVTAGMMALREYWNSLIGNFQLETEDARLRRMVNVWNPYQCMVTFNLSRSASYYESGIGRGMGFRDCNQDLLGVVHMVPTRARERILDIAATQFPDGSAYHQYQPLTKRGNHDIGTGFNDDPLWLILAVCEYTKETGDYAILDDVVAFDHNNHGAPLLEHLQRAFEHVVANRGPHGLPLIGRADWNDCLNLNCFSTNPDESFQSAQNQAGQVAESVLIAGMFVYIGEEYAALLRHIGQAKRADVVALHIDDMRRAVMRHGFDGEWYLRAYDARGQKVGSKENDEGQIFAEPQGFCSMAGIGKDEGFCQRALDSVAARLLSRFGIMLQQPAYSRYYPSLGEISSYPPGYKENAGVFCHNNPWIMIAECLLGRGDKAFDYYKRIAPAFSDDCHETRRTEPYVYAQMVAGPDAPNSGQAKNSWLTGTAAWNYAAITQFMLGIRARHDGLQVSPRIAGEIDAFHVTRLCRGAEYRISVRPVSQNTKAGLYIGDIRQTADVIPYARPSNVVMVRCDVC